MTSTFGGLSSTHEELVRTYLKFVRAKREIALKSMEGEFRDIKNDRLSEDMYSQGDMEDILDGLKACVITNLHQEVGAVANMTALLMKQMLEGAEQQGITLGFNTSSVEDQALLEEVERMAVDGTLKQGGGGQASRLLSIKDEHARLVEHTTKLKGRIEELEECASRLERERSEAARQRDEGRAEAEFLRRKLRFHADDKSDRCSMEQPGAKAGDELEALKEAYERKLSESPQFQELKRILASKNKQVVSLRRRLARYEPDDDRDARLDDEEKDAAI